MGSWVWSHLGIKAPTRVKRVEQNLEINQIKELGGLAERVMEHQRSTQRMSSPTSSVRRSGDHAGSKT